MGAPHVLANPPRVALIGSGFIGPVHAEALRRIGVVVGGLLDISPERARPLAERLGISKVYSTLDELLADPSISTVHIASPNNVHFEHAKRRLEAGKHVPLREAAGGQCQGDRRAGQSRHGASQAGGRSELQSSLLSAMPGDARPCRPGRAGPDLVGLGLLHPGLAAPDRRL